MTIEAAETLALQTLKQVMEEKINSTNIEIATVTKTSPFRMYTTEEVEALLTRL
jgi:20S proteasome subunit alpha 5